MNLTDMTALEIGKLIKNREISCIEASRNVLDAINSADKYINAYVSVDENTALSAAKKVQERLDAGEELSLLAGVPVSIKDNICTKNFKTTCSSRMLEEFTPPYNATAVEKLEEAGAVIIGKLNMDEFAMGGSTETSYFSKTKNPWNTEYVPGGSSGGSAAAVAAREAIYTLGSDTGGSIRQPCSFCGVSGIKPTYGSVSRYGLIPYASSLDQIGTVGKDIRDCAAALKIISGYDEKDSTSIMKQAFDFDNVFTSNIEGMVIGLNCPSEGMDSDVYKAVMESAKKFEELGAKIEEFEIPLLEYAVPAYYIIACAEASSNLSRYDGVKYGYRTANAKNLSDLYINSRSEGFGIEVKRRIMLGSFALSSGYYDAYYHKAQQVRGLIKKSFDNAFKKYDMILSPVAPTAAYKIGENISDPIKMFLGDIYTVPVNLAGIPAVALPCGFDKNNMPIGIQLIGDVFSEAKLVRAADTYQQNTDYHKRRCGEWKL